ncbi:up-regulator of cell proliferation-like [Pundamilia nyererei]|uniref:Up-regulator of cell proliferation-like n=1 Tax=Pundamilia nyererei TaxID=303518 RepID=A0A9Y6LYG0_9CICH|nr:PREDICTED: up-regulator of cell proliferation-like [Pundamilia nyererei]
MKRSEPNNLKTEEEKSSHASEDMKDQIKVKHLESLLEELGLKQYYREKLSLSRILEIGMRTTTDEPAKCKSDLSWYFLQKLMMFNVTARNVKCTLECESNSDDESGSKKFSLKSLVCSPNTDDMVNPLDIITALFLCSDGFLQQEMALKMSMCQFSVPLLLPSCDTGQCTLMLWAMRDIVKKYRAQSLSESKGFIEDRIVLSELPMISFVRLGECSLSKSKFLNKLLSNSQQYHDTFVHRNMECGDSPRRISNGLTEITWYLPCGNTNIDIFRQPVAVANLRGDIASFETQYSFLCQTSAAVFVFFDHLDSESESVINLLKSQHHKGQVFLVGNYESKRFNLDALEKVASELGLNKNNIIIKTKQKNDANFVKDLKKTVSNVVEKSELKMKIEEMVDVAHELGILVDEDSPECQTAKENAKTITAGIQDIYKYKEDELPRQGQIWKTLTSLEKEEFRLRHVGSKNVENYKSDLQKQKEELRQKQNSYEISTAMTNFITGISSPGTERFYFLKWMRMNLDNVSRIKLCELREKYKEKCKNSENKEEIKEIDKQISNSSLGIEHFFREMGQIYEASLSLSKTHPSRQQLHHLPKLCAELLLDGFPLELVDGDASNIPLRWVSDVLSQLSDLVSPKKKGKKRKILVVTVLGVQSTGKSTLLNTMFGVQFAVSSGRCTRGAFMLLIKINENFKNILKCDFLVIIDTEGLKSPELAQLDNSYEHDNELATLVVGLSDVTIVNIAMENLIEMKDILQIVVHAFLRMKEVGKKPKCQFVHQNVSDVSAHEKNLRDRKLLLDQLNEMTQAAAKMEKKEENKSFTDVMEYSPDTGNWYIPGLWNGNPPMAPVSAGYSEAVYELKKNIIQLLRDCESSANDIMEFKEWVKSLWNAVKHENFIFSFRNSLVADAYMKLCTEFNKWEWEFRKDMYTWHICGFAAREFQKMHEDFIEENDPYRCLIKNKERFHDDFKDVFHERDQCQKKAEEFTKRCLKPAVEDFVNRSLGPDIIDEMRKLEQFSTRMSFQYSILLDLLSKEDFQNYVSYIRSYEKYVKTWILEQIKKHFSNESTVFEFEERHLRSCIDSINSAINKAKTRKSDGFKAFVEEICKELGDKLVISQDALGAFMILNNADKEQFADWLTASVNDLEKALRIEFKESTFDKRLEHLCVEPQDELFSQLIGCGKQCPFCKAPCDAGGKAHGPVSSQSSQSGLSPGPKGLRSEGPHLAMGARAAAGSELGTYLCAQPERREPPTGAINPRPTRCYTWGGGKQTALGLTAAERPSIPHPSQTANSTQSPAPMLYRERGVDSWKAETSCKDVTSYPPVEEAPISTSALESPCTRAGPPCIHPPTTPAIHQPGPEPPGASQSPSPEVEHPQKPKPAPEHPGADWLPGQ